MHTILLYKDPNILAFIPINKLNIQLKYAHPKNNVDVSQLWFFLGFLNLF